ncbi:carbohydrate ABC transporter permease [Thermococcus atlanticus]
MNDKTLYELKRIGFYTLVFVIIIWMGTPLIVSTLYAFGTPDAYYNPHEIVPLSFTFNTVKMLLFTLGGWEALKNSVIVATMTIIISFILGLPAGYSLARFIFPGKDSIKLGMLALKIFPVPIMAVPLVMLYIRLHLLDTRLGVALAHSAGALPLVVLITASIFAGTSRELEEAGMVFGLTRFQSFLKITLPLALPGLAAAAMFTFVGSWNEVFAASVLTFSHRTLPALMLTLMETAPDYYKFAAAFIMAFPAMIYVALARRYLISMWGIALK